MTKFIQRKDGVTVSRKKGYRYEIVASNLKIYNSKTDVLVFDLSKAIFSGVDLKAFNVLRLCELLRIKNDKIVNLS